MTSVDVSHGDVGTSFWGLRGRRTIVVKQTLNLTATLAYLASLRYMQRIAITTMIVLAAIVASTSISAARPVRRAPTKCVRGHSRIITADAQAQVYEAPEPPGAPEALGVYGCAYGSNRTYFLGPLPFASVEDAGGVSDETLAGPIIAYNESSVRPCCSNRSLVVVRNLLTGKILRHVPSGTPTVPKTGYVGIGPVVSIVVKKNGAVAWIVETGYPNEYQVHAMDQSGSRLLASSAEIEPDSLALGGNVLYWTEAHRPFSALLN
jgi:hypothetical protein